MQSLKQSRASTRASGIRVITLCLLDVDWHPRINILSMMSCFPIYISSRVAFITIIIIVIIIIIVVILSITKFSIVIGSPVIGA